MAIYHLSVKIIRRSSGRSSVAAAAYRSGDILTNEWDGLTHVQKNIELNTPKSSSHRMHRKNLKTAPPYGMLWRRPRSHQTP